MAKKCNKCGFMNNPDDSHFCGKCGNKLEYCSDWKVYDGFYYTPIRNSKLSEYRRYEQQVKDSWLIDPWGKVKKWWNDTGVALAVIFGIIIGLSAIISGCFVFFFKSCSSEKEISRIEVNGKYGIGYSKDNLLIPAKYDMIFDDPNGNQWLIYDGKRSLKGLAYVTDKVQNITDIEYSDIKRGVGHYTLLRKSPVNNVYNSEYEYVAYDGKILNDSPFNALKCVGDWDGSGIFMERTPDYKIQLYSRNLDKIGPSYSGILISEEDSVLVAQGTEESVLYNLKGQRLSTGSLYRGYVFSDGVGWAYDTKQDYRNGKLSLIDKTGKILFNRQVKKYSSPIQYSEDMGWYQSPSGKWVAVDKKGMARFEINAMSVYPFTMGLAPVYQGSSSYDRKMGFVDKSGKTVIPFKYIPTSYPPKFGRDSLMTVTLDGKGGKLHRNGTFYLVN